MKRKPYHPPHIYLDDTTYFITAKTLNRQPIFANGDRKAKFRNFLRAKLIKYEVKCSAWVILNEHYHILIHIKNKSQLPRFIKSLHGESAIWLNKKDESTSRVIHIMQRNMAERAFCRHGLIIRLQYMERSGVRRIVPNKFGLPDGVGDI